MKNSKEFDAAVLINATKESVWDALYTRFGETYLFNPNLEGSHFSHGSTGEVGCVRQCNLDGKTHIQEKIIQVDPQKSFAIELVGGNMPMVNELRVAFSLRPEGSFKTRVVLNAEFSTTPAFMAFIMKAPFKKRLTAMLVGLKYYLETGKPVTKKTYRPVYQQFKKLQLNDSFAN